MTLRGLLGPAEKKKSIEIKFFACLRKNIFLSIYSLISGSRIKNIYTFFLAMNF